MTQCSKCNHIGRPKTKSKFGTGKMIFLSFVLFIIVGIISGGTFIFIGEYDGLCYGPSCFEWAGSRALVVILISIAIMIYTGVQEIEVCEKCGEEIKKD